MVRLDMSGLLLPTSFFILSWNVIFCSGMWWLLTVPPATDNQQIQNSREARDYCDSIRFLKGIQKEFCFSHPTLMQKISEGLKSGIRECQYQFRHSKWNCSTYSSNPRNHVFKPIVKTPTREAAFINAIIAASVTFEVTKACSVGDLPDECACAKIRKTDVNWGGCSDDITFGEDVSKQFLDGEILNSSSLNLKNQINLHNSEAGRKVVRSQEKQVCKCHGLSGACTQTVCWRAMSTLRIVSDTLKEHYDGAISVKNVKRKKLRPKEKDHKKPTAVDLVYSQSSKTDFCTRNLKFGSYGTQGRLCNATSRGNDGCAVMCCDRSFETRRVTRRYDCNCTFEWCCRLNCQSCVQIVSESRCV